MAASQIISASGGLRLAGLGDWIAGARARFARYRAYRTTVSELSALSDAELNDLALSRAMIPGLAYRAVYEGDAR